MLYKRLFISGLIVNSLTACSSSPMELSQPKGEWVDFEQGAFQSNVTEAKIPSNNHQKPNSEYTTKKGTDKRKEKLPNKPSDKDMLINSSENHKEVLSKFTKPVQTKTVTASHMQSTPINSAGTPHKKIFTESVVLATPVVPKPTQAAKAPIKTKPAILMPVLKSWTISKGTTLKAGYLSWVQKEKCGDREWVVRWDTDTDYPIDYPLSFRSASFEDATSQLFNLYRTAQAPLYVSGYRNQCLIVISDRK